MSSWFSWLWGAPSATNNARDSIVGLREQLLILDKREEHLARQIENQLSKAKANVGTNKACEFRSKVKGWPRVGWGRPLGRSLAGSGSEAG